MVLTLFFQKNYFQLFDVLWYFKLWRIPLCYLFLLFRTFYASIFHYKIDNLEEYSLAMNIATSFTCVKSQYYTAKSSFSDLSKLRKENASNRLDVEGAHDAVGIIKCSWGFGRRCEPPNGFRADPWWGLSGRSARKLHDFHVSQAPTLA